MVYNCKLKAHTYIAYFSMFLPRVAYKRKCNEDKVHWSHKAQFHHNSEHQTWTTFSFFHIQNDIPQVAPLYCRHSLALHSSSLGPRHREELCDKSSTLQHNHLPLKNCMQDRIQGHTAETLMCWCIVSQSHLAGFHKLHILGLYIVESSAQYLRSSALYHGNMIQFSGTFVEVFYDSPPTFVQVQDLQFAW